MKIVHYLNQFFGQLGGEDAAYAPPQVREGAVGPGAALEAQLSGAQIVCTIICGDNFFVENTEDVEQQIIETLKKYEADLVVAGPAFNAGRYGMACGNVLKIAFGQGIPAVSGMYEENPGLDLYKVFGYVFPTDINAKGMRDALAKMAAFINKMARGEEILFAKEEGYFKRGLRVNVWKEKTGATRAVDMMLDKVAGRPFETEITVPVFDRIPPSPPVRDLSKAKVALITSGGIVPKGNPDRLEALSASKWMEYTAEDFGGSYDLPESEVAHGGYDPVYGNEDGTRVLPADALKELERQGVIGEFYPKMFVTVGNCMEVLKAERYGKEMAARLLDEEVDCAILTST